MGLTDYLAIYGAILSTAVFVWNALRTTPRFKLRIAYAADGRGKKVRSGIGVSIQNPSSQPVHINGLSFLYPYRRVGLIDRIRDAIRFKNIFLRSGWCYASFSLYETSCGCPVTVEPGKSHYVFVPEEALKRVLRSAIRRSLRVVAQDALYRNSESPIFDYAVPKRRAS